MKSIALVSLFGVAAFLTLMAVSSQLWLDPLTPLVVGLLGIALPMVIAVALMEPGFRKLQVEIIALTAASALFLGVVLPGLWFKGEFRIHAVSLSTTKNIELVLDDPHLPIREAGCDRAFELNLGVDEVVRLIQSRPTIVSSCLDRPDLGTIPRRLASQWRSELNLATSCDLAGPLKSLDSLAKEERAIELLDCALQAENSEVRDCCTISVRELLKGQPLADTIMKASSDFHRRGLLSQLILLSHGETETMKTYDGQIVRVAGLTAPEVKAATLHAGCRATLNDSTQTRLTSALRWTLDYHIDCVTDPAHREVTPLVLDVCFDFVQSEASLDAYCALNRTHRAKRLEDQARAEQVRPSRDLGDLADAIGVGHSKVNVTVESYIDNVSRERDGKSLDQYSPAEQAALRRNIAAMRPQVSQPSEVKGTLEGGQKRLNELKNNAELLRLSLTKDQDEVDQIRKSFEEREKRAKESGEGPPEEP